MLYYIATSQSCFIYSKVYYTVHNFTHPSTRGTLPRLRSGIAHLQPLYFRLNFVGDVKSGIVARVAQWRGGIQA